MGVATGIAIGSAIAAAYAAHKQSQSAEEARNAETSAGDKALAVQERMYNQQRADNDPYLSAGRVALGNLGDLSQRSRMTFDPNNPASLMGLPKPTTTAGPMTAQTGGPTAGFQPAQPSVDPRMGGTPNFQPSGASGPSLMPRASLGQPGGTQGPSGSGAGQMVLMEAPDGERRPVPQSMVRQFEQRGGKVVQ